MLTFSVRNILGSNGVQPDDHPSHALLGSNTSFVLPDGSYRASFRAVIGAVDTPTVTEVQLRVVNVKKVEVTVFETEEELVPVVTEVNLFLQLCCLICFLNAYSFNILFRDNLFKVPKRSNNAAQAIRKVIQL